MFTNSSGPDSSQHIPELFRMYIRHLALLTALLPLGGFLLCLSLSFGINFENSTYTHCEVDNFAPSISAAIGSFIPQKYIWQASIALHLAPRFLFACLLNQHLYQRLKITPTVRRLLSTSLILQFTENLALLSLTIVSSQENFPIHSWAFGIFGAASTFYMLIVVYLVKRCGYQHENRFEKKGIEWKVWLLKGTLFVGLLMCYFYWRHNAYCEPYIYSFFGMCEYLLVLFNIAFHGTAYYDFYDREITVLKPSSHQKNIYSNRSTASDQEHLLQSVEAQ